MKGIILAGGLGTRLRPLTGVVSKQLLPVYNRPMVYYPLMTLLRFGIRDILLISDNVEIFERLLGDGEKFGCRISYLVQEYPNGIAESFIIGEEFIGNDNICLILGDNIFIGDLGEVPNCPMIYGVKVNDPCRYGVIHGGRVIEKPLERISDWVVPGLYFYDSSVVGVAKGLEVSSRGELEITDINNYYLDRGMEIGYLEGVNWFDAGTFDSLLDAGSFIRSVESRHGSVGGDLGF